MFDADCRTAVEQDIAQDTNRISQRTLDESTASMNVAGNLAVEANPTVPSEAIGTHTPQVDTGDRLVQSELNSLLHDLGYLQSPSEIVAAAERYESHRALRSRPALLDLMEGAVPTGDHEPLDTLSALLFFARRVRSAASLLNQTSLPAAAAS